MQITVTTPERLLIKDYEVEYLQLNTDKFGQIRILDKHCDYVATLDTGLIAFVGKEDRKSYLGVISGGFVEVLNNHALVLANTLELADEIDFDRVRLAKKKAEEMLAKTVNPEERFKYDQKLRRAIARANLEGRK
jgi:F-type H+-transporting ATPase subunit epsilon